MLASILFQTFAAFGVDVITVAGLPDFDGVQVGVSAIAFIPSVAGVSAIASIPSVAGVSAVAGIPAVDGVFAIVSLPILASLCYLSILNLTSRHNRLSANRTR
jgi:hypothetical protein